MVSPLCHDSITKARACVIYLLQIASTTFRKCAPVPPFFYPALSILPGDLSLYLHFFWSWFHVKWMSRAHVCTWKAGNHMMMARGWTWISMNLWIELLYCIQSVWQVVTFIWFACICDVLTCLQTQTKHYGEDPCSWFVHRTHSPHVVTAKRHSESNKSTAKALLVAQLLHFNCIFWLF